MSFINEQKLLELIASADTGNVTAELAQELRDAAAYIKGKADELEQDALYRRILSQIEGNTVFYNPVPVEVKAPILSPGLINDRVIRHKAAVEKVIERNVTIIRTLAAAILTATNPAAPMTLTTALIAAKPLVDVLLHEIKDESQSS